MSDPTPTPTPEPTPTPSPSPSPTPTPTPTPSPEGQPTPTPAPADGPKPADTPWQDNLPKALAEDPLFRGYKTIDDLAQAHQHLTKLKGAPANELLRIPSKPLDQAPEDWKPIFAAIGVPADVKDYKIELAAEAATDAPALEGVLRELGGKANLNQAGMNAVVETLNTLGKAAAEADAAALAASTKETAETLTKEWGAAAEGNRRAIGKLIRDAMGGEIDEQAAADLETSLGSNLTLSRVLAHAIGKMAEPEAPGGGNALPQTTQMTPAAAKAALSAKYADRDWSAALNSRSHPQHAAVMAERDMLLAQQRGEKRPDAVA
ncbi:hypothetical protein [Brevundimonas sp.]|uniref:hypothetical protein n=1 Tax=Brevundimonas sp. TaxID=1871086 RepID=UPI00286A5A00|nr:hypothetical protein [Brevundimonas sp.]